MDNKEIALPNSLTSAKPVFSEEQMQNFSEMMNSPDVVVKLFCNTMT